MIPKQIEKILIRIQKILDKELLHNLGTPKMSALTSCKFYLTQARKYAMSYQKHLENEQNSSLNQEGGSHNQEQNRKT